MLGERDGLGADRRHPGRVDEVEHVLHREHPDDRGRPREEAPDAVVRRVRRTHLERRRAPHPALDRLRERALEVGAHVAERGRAGTPVEVLVRAARREVDAPRVELDRDRARGVAQVPQDERPGVVREGRDRGGVAHVPRPVRDVAEQHERGAVGEDLRHLLRGHAAVVVGRDPPQRRAVLARDALQHVPVRREVPGVEHDLVAARDLRRRERGAHELVEDHRRRVPDERLARRRAERHRADPVAQRQRELVPLLVPAADEPRTPDVGRAPRAPPRRHGGRARGPPRGPG